MFLRSSRALAVCASLLALAVFHPLLSSAAALGAFESHGDIGAVLHPGTASYDSATQSYTVRGSGENMWFDKDDFHFVWKKVSGDVALSADIAFDSTTGNNHRKAVLMVRQSLDPGSPYVDVARHGDGLTSLQYRDEPNANTHEVEASVSAPARIRIERRGATVYAYVQGYSGKLEPSGASIKIPLTGEFYIGLGVCSHEKDASTTAHFSHVTLESLPPARAPLTLYSTLETVNIASTDRRVTYVAPAHFEAPNWSRDGSFLVFNQDGLLWHVPFVAPSVTQSSAVVPARIQTGAQTHCNNDHGLSPDGAQIAISDNSAPDGRSRVYVLPLAGGEPRQVTSTGPSYFHGWSPDGNTLAFTGQREGDFDIYTVPADGDGAAGRETRLTTAKGLDDGPEYSPDGAYIYFNSERTGSMQIWRMRPDGGGQEQVLHDGDNDWFPHLSPDGKWLVFLAYAPDVAGHPADKDVELRLMSLADKKVTLLAKLFGGQGTINVASWSPDSTRVAFVSYEYLP